MSKPTKTKTGSTWIISVVDYGAFLFQGTEAEAEEMRRHKARWEGAIAKKYLATPEDIKYFNRKAKEPAP
jgi:hypothetical protein